MVYLPMPRGVGVIGLGYCDRLKEEGVGNERTDGDVISMRRYSWGVVSFMLLYISGVV